MDSYLDQNLKLKLKTPYGFVSAFVFSECYLMDWSGVDYCDVFISCLDSHSDGTHSLQSIHWWSDTMLYFSKSDEETNSSTCIAFKHSCVLLCFFIPFLTLECSAANLRFHTNFILMWNIANNKGQQITLMKKHTSAEKIISCKTYKKDKPVIHLRCSDKKNKIKV